MMITQLCSRLGGCRVPITIITTYSVITPLTPTLGLHVIPINCCAGCSSYVSQPITSITVFLLFPAYPKLLSEKTSRLTSFRHVKFEERLQWEEWLEEYLRSASVISDLPRTPLWPSGEYHLRVLGLCLAVSYPARGPRHQILQKLCHAQHSSNFSNARLRRAEYHQLPFPGITPHFLVTAYQIIFR